MPDRRTIRHGINLGQRRHLLRAADTNLHDRAEAEGSHITYCYA